MNSSSVRLSLTESLWLEPEHFSLAKTFSNRFQGESQQWQAYLNSLGLSAFEVWAREKLPTATVQVESAKTAARTEPNSYLTIEGFSVCLIATEHVLDEVIRFPRSLVEAPDLAAHLYVVLEIIEEQQEAVIRGCLRYDELIRQLEGISQSSNQPLNQYLLPLSAWDEEINHLLGYVQYSHPSTIALPQAATEATGDSRIEETSLTRLGQWIETSITEGWQSIDQLINPEANLAWSTRADMPGIRGGKLINLGMLLDQHTVALVVTVMPEDGKIGVNVQILPTGDNLTLPSQLTVTLRSSTDRVLQEVTSRAKDNYIQLRSFRGKSGIQFTVEVALNGVKVSEVFKL